MKIKLLSLLACTTLICSCEKEKASDSVTPFSSEPGGVFISNEGNYGSSNSSVSYYNPSDGKFYDDAYKTFNDQSLGDVCQSINLINGNLFLVVNNSGKIEICNPSTMKRLKTITGLTSPRYIVRADSSKAYVSDAYSNHISIINLNNYSVSGTILLNGWTEQMILVNNKVYVTNTSTEYVYIIDASNDLLSDSIHISPGANSIREDKNGKIWILCSGDYLQTYNGALYRIDPATKQIELNIPFSASAYPSRLCMNSTNDTMYFLNIGVWRMSIGDNAVPAQPFIASSGNSFYGLAVDESRDEIYVSDAVDYIQKGKIFRYSPDGSSLGNFRAGISPGDFIFLP